jgi:hypothetical protein
MNKSYSPFATRHGIRFCLAATVLVLSASSTFAQPLTSAVTISGGLAGNNVDHRTVGWAFDVNRTIVIEALGWYDRDADGLSQSYEVGIWHDASQTLLTSATVPSGVAGALVDSFRYVNLASSFILHPGTYVIGGVAVAPPDRIVERVQLQSAPAITYLGNRANNTFTQQMLFPGETSPANQTPGFFGPNFQFIVPEPSTGMLFAGSLALSICGSLVRRTRVRVPRI